MVDLTHEKFFENLHTRFRLRLNDSTTVELVLVEVSEQRSPLERRCFRLSFVGRNNASTNLFSLEHERMETFDIFLVPVGLNDGSYEYEAVFNRLIERTSD